MKSENIKTLEIRDRATCIPAFAIKMIASDEKELYLFRHCGYRTIHEPCILLIPIQSPWQSTRSSDEWREPVGRSLPIAHKWIEKNFDDIQNGDVIDVEYLLKEVEYPCPPILQEELNEFINIAEKEMNKKKDTQNAT